MKIKKDQVKKILVITFIAFLSLYFIWDISSKTANQFRLQGYEYAITEIVIEAENQNCVPFNIFAGDREISLINVDCLQIMDQEGYPMTDEDIEGF